MDNSERLDGMNEIYLTVMTAQEWSKAVDYLLIFLHERRARKTVHRLFLADGETAAPIAQELFDASKLHEDAEIAAAWGLQKIAPNATLLPAFIRLMASTDKYNRYGITRESVSKEAFSHCYRGLQ